MLNLLSAEQSRQADQFSMENEPVQSIDLMERAALAFVSAFIRTYPDKKKPVAVYCGTGNNGGDGLAIARLLSERGFEAVTIKVARFSSNSSADFRTNYERALHLSISEIRETDPFPVEDAEIIIDALLGTGLNKPLDGPWRELVIWLNSLQRTIVSVDVPTGFKSEGIVSEKEIAIKSDLVISFQRPKINFLLPESSAFIEEFRVVDIGLDEAFIQSVSTPYALLTEADISNSLRKRKAFSHKGTYGHSLIIAGAAETMGAALLCSEACLYSGAGLTTACIPPEGLVSLNSRTPEVMAVLRKEGDIPQDLNWGKYSALAIGPGIGTSAEGKLILEKTLNRFDKPAVFDADALNLISKNYELISFVPEGSVFTPHVKEFDRLFGEHQSWWERLQTGMDRAKSLNCVILLKNRYSVIFTPEGKCIFNPTGTPAMATGGMGDVLTGMIASFLAQAYPPVEATLLGVYLHGLAAEQILEKQKAAVIPAAVLVKEIPEVIARLTRQIK